MVARDREMEEDLEVRRRLNSDKKKITISIAVMGSQNDDPLFIGNMVGISAKK